MRIQPEQCVVQLVCLRMNFALNMVARIKLGNAIRTGSEYLSHTVRRANLRTNICRSNVEPALQIVQLYIFHHMETGQRQIRAYQKPAADGAGTLNRTHQDLTDMTRKAVDLRWWRVIGLRVHTNFEVLLKTTTAFRCLIRIVVAGHSFLIVIT